MYEKKGNLLSILVEVSPPITSFLKLRDSVGKKCRATLDTPSALTAVLAGHRMAVPGNGLNVWGL